MSYIIAFSNQKGGVGKTTTTRELGLYLASTGLSVCIIDADPQANLTKSLTETIRPGLFEALSGMQWDFTSAQGVSLLSGSIACATLEKSLVGELDAYVRMKELLSDTRFSGFDYILIDCPPSLGVLTVNALTAAAFVIIPMNPSLYSMQGVNDLLSTVARIKKSLNPALAILGALINAYDRTPVITRQICEEIAASFGELLFPVRISKAIVVEEAIAAKERVSGSSHRVAHEIQSAGDELLRRVEAYHG